MKPAFHLPLVAAAACAFASPTFGQAIETDVLARVIDTTCIDLTDDIGCEMVTLLKSRDDPSGADIFIMPNIQNDATAPILIVRNAAWTGGLFGDTPHLEQTAQGSLMVTSKQSGSGRTPWRESHTIAMRGGQLVVAGYTFSSYDRLDNSTFACDVNLLNGAYEATATPPQINLQTGELLDDDRVFEDHGRGEAAAYPLAELSNDFGILDTCARIRDGWKLD